MTTDHEDPTDAELLARHREGDASAFGDLIARHQDRMWAVALRTVRNPEDAADAVQDAAIKAYRSAGSFRGDAQVTTWLHRIVVNACLDLLRRKKVRPADAFDDDEDRMAELGVSPAADPVVNRERRLDVLDALQMISADQRAAIVLVDMEGYSVDEAAAILDCAPGTVKSRCARGRAKLAPLLSDWWNQSDDGRVLSSSDAPTRAPGGDDV